MRVSYNKINIYNERRLRVNHKEWKYKIGKDRVAVLLMLMMSGMFGGAAAWLYKADNGAFIPVSMIAGLMVLVFLLTLHRFFFYKVLIGEDGFYYQTNIGNGKFYSYREVEKAWMSSGTDQNGGTKQYCNIAVPGKSVIRFLFFFQDECAVNYLIGQVEQFFQNTESDGNREKEEYLIDGKVFGKMQMGIGAVIVAMIVSLNLFLVKKVGLTLIGNLGVVMALVVACLLCNRYFFFQVKIKKDGFYCRTNPFDGCYYTYEEIVACRTIRKIVRHRQGYWDAAQRRYYFFFEFTDFHGKNHKFQFEQEIYEQEIRVLKERIEHTGNEMGW